MDQIVFLGMGETGSDIVTAVASAAISHKVRINGDGRICCAHVYDDGQAFPEDLANIICCRRNSVDTVVDALADASDCASAVIVADLSEINPELCLDTVANVKDAFAKKDRSAKIKGFFVLPDNGAFSSIRSVFDTVWFISDDTEAGRVNVSRDALISSVSANIYTRYLTLLAEEFASQEKDAEAKANGKPVYGVIGYAKAVYPVDSVASYCAYRGGCDIIDKLNLAIDTEIYTAAAGKPVSREAFRKEYIKRFEDKVENDPNGLFQQLKGDLRNETAALDAAGEVEYSYSDKVEDFLLITKNLINIFSADKDITSLESYKTGMPAEFISDVNALSVEVANELLVNALPYRMSLINQKNDGSAFGMISHVGGDIPEDRIYLHPVASRYLLYRLSLALTEIRSGIDVAAEAEGVTSAFEGTDKFAAASEYFKKAVLVSFAKVFGDRLERLIAAVEDYFASLTDVYDHFAEGADKNAEADVSADPSLIFVSSSKAAKEEIYRARPVSIEGQTPVTPTISKFFVAQYCLGEDCFDQMNRSFIGKDPGYSFEYNAYASYRKFYNRSKIPGVSVNNGLYTLCGTEDAFKALVGDIKKAATPVCSASDVKYVWPISSALVAECPALGEILGCDVEKYQIRGVEKSVLECFSTAYGVDPSEFIK